MAKNEVLESVALSLRMAAQSLTPILPPSKQYDIGVEDGYCIQKINRDHQLSLGHRIVGYKIGLTSRAAQQHFGVFERDFGHLFESMCVLEESEIDLSRLVQPKIEGEIAFVLGKDLRGPGVTIVDVLSAV